MSTRPDPAADTRTRILDTALTLITKSGGADVTMLQIAKAARLSRQAVYLHFADRAELLVSLVRHVDEKRNLSAKLKTIEAAPTGMDAVRGMIALQATDNPRLWRIAQAFDAVRRQDPDAERSWQDRLGHRLEGCRTMVARLQSDGVLRSGLDPGIAADLLWTLTSLRMWEDLVIGRGWSGRRYREHVGVLVLGALTDSSGKRSRRRNEEPGLLPLFQSPRSTE